MANPALSILEDGSFAPLDAITPVRFYYTEKPTALIGRQTYRLNPASFATAANNTPGPVIQGLNTYLVQQTDPTPDDFNKFTFDRVWSTLPFNWEDRDNVEKQYQAGLYVFQGTVDPRPIVDSSVSAWTGTVRARIFYSYYLDILSVPTTEGRSALQTVRFFNSQFLTDNGSGFPTRFQFGNTIYDNNTGYSFMSAQIVPYMGAMVGLKKIYG